MSMNLIKNSFGSESLNKRLSTSMRWNVLESVLYHAMLLIHQIALLQMVSRATYGLIGATFSLIYFLITMCNLGFDLTFSSFFSQVSASKHSIKRYFITQYLPSFFILFMALGILFIFFMYNPVAGISGPVLLLIGVTILSESIKKSAKIVLQLLFHNRFHALIETTLMVLYCILIWAPWLVGIPITLFSVVWPLLATSLIGLAFFGYKVIEWYQRAPCNIQREDHNSPITSTRVAKTRLYAFANQLSTLFFTTNFQVPLFAFTHGFEYAALFKFVSTLIYTITHIIDKVFGSASSAILSQVKHGTLSIKQHYFQLISWRTQQLVFVILFCSIFNYRFIIGNISESSILAVCFFYLLINLIDHCAVTYERLFIVEEVAHYLLLVNAASGFVAALALYILFSFPAWQLLAVASSIRLISFASLLALTYRIWGIKPTIGASFFTVGLSCAISIILFLFSFNK